MGYMKIKILYSDSIVEMDNFLRDYVEKDGWQPYGDLKVQTFQDDSSMFYMVITHE